MLIQEPTKTHPSSSARSALAGTWLDAAAIILLYAATAFVIPIMTDAAVSDDWMYAWHVEGLLRSYEFRLHELSTSNAIFHTVWGALFAAGFGMSFGALRLSTVVLVALSGFAMYGLCRELGAERRACALATAAYLFNPLAFVLSYTFMTDSHFTALLVMSTYFYLRGLGRDSPASGAIIAGSAFAGLAYLVRPHGLLIPLAVAVYLVSRRQVDWSARSLSLLARIGLLPAFTVLVFQLWLRYVHGVPRMQAAVWSMLFGMDVGRFWELAAGLAWAEAMYVGFFVLPLVAAGVPRVRLLVRRTPPAARALVATWLGCLVIGVLLYADRGRFMPYIPQFFTRWGLGPNDLLGGRPVILSTLDLVGLTLLAAVGSTFLLLLVWGAARAGSSAPDLDDDGAAGEAGLERRHMGRADLCASMLVGQAIAALITSVHVPANWISYDRYLLPLLPLALGLGVWGLRGSRPAMGVGWVTVAALALFSIAGTRDFLIMQRETWKLARWANASGMTNEHLDGGAAWDGWSFASHPGATRGPIRTPGPPPWWVSLWGRPTDSSYVISGAHLPGYDVVRRVEYPTVLAIEPTHIYLLRRHGVRAPL